MLYKACNRCGKNIPYGKAYCSACFPVVEKEKQKNKEKAKQLRDRRYNEKRDKKYTSFYNSKAWKMLSKGRLSDDHYRCVKCGAIACEVDHIVEIRTPEGWERRYDYSNLQSLCHDCHNKKHNRFC